MRYGNVAGSRGSIIPLFREISHKNVFPITDKEMTRFWISLQGGVDFVLNCFERMLGGEIFVPKIPSVRIVDLAKAMAPEIPLKIIGIRPGEKLHEVMCPADDSHLTIEFENFFVISPSIVFYSREMDFTENALGEKGEPVGLGEEYSSGTNTNFLNVEEIRLFNAQNGYQ